MNDATPLLRELGFDENMAQVYFALVDLGRATIKQIQAMNKPGKSLSYSQVYHALKKLLNAQVVEQHPSFEDSFSPVNPSLVFDEIKQQKWEKLARIEQDLADRYERSTKEFGMCTIQTNRFYFSSLDLGFKIITDRFINSATTILVFLAPPPTLIRQLLPALTRAYGRGVKLEIHYSVRDFEEYPNYPAVLLALCKNIRVKLVQRQFRTYDAVAINDELTRVGSLLIDNQQLVSVPYHRIKRTNGEIDFGIDFFEGFFQAQAIVQNIIAGFPENPILQMIDSIPPRESQILEYLKDHPRSPKHELSLALGIGGTDLREILARLTQHGLILTEKVPQNRGRPVEVVRLA
ncbi:MAG: hypothetical protein RBG13Loki_1200 [Promethearchaeota archaeon CR_4]|nr:MAG: hypothetical protein RBG13Loki_1200 [Candidatus Lokiarchaeota archaeon CR_4]